MKRVIFALFLCFVFSFSVHAKKQQIFVTIVGSLNESAAGSMCTYTCTRAFAASVHAHKGSRLAFNLIIDDESTTLTSTPVYETDNFSRTWCKASFDVPRGKSWTVIWTLESTKGKGRIIDAAGELSGTCNP